MAYLYQVDVSPEKLAVLNSLIQQFFRSPLILRHSLRSIAIQNLRQKHQEILQDMTLPDPVKFGLILLLLKSINDKGRQNSFMVFSAETLNKKAENILIQVLLNTDAIETLLTTLVKKNKTLRLQKPFAAQQNKINFKAQARLNLITCALSAAVHEIAIRLATMGVDLKKALIQYGLVQAYDDHVDFMARNKKTA